MKSLYAIIISTLLTLNSFGQAIDLVMQTGHKGEITAIAVSKDGKYAATGGSDQSIKIWDVRSGTIIKDFHEHKGTITQLAFSDDNFYLVSCAEDKRVKIWEVEYNPNNQIVSKLSQMAMYRNENIKNAPKAKKYDPKNPMMATGNQYQFDYQGNRVKQERPDLSSTALKTFTFPESKVSSLALKSDFSEFIVVGENGTIYLYDPLKFAYYAQLKTNHNDVIACSYDAADKNMWVVRKSGASVWSNKGKVLATFNHQDVMSIQNSRANGTISLLSKSGELYEYESKKLKFLSKKSLKIEKQTPIYQEDQLFSFSASGTFLVEGKSYDCGFHLTKAFLLPDKRHALAVDDKNELHLYDYVNKHEVYKVSNYIGDYTHVGMSDNWDYNIQANTNTGEVKLFNILHGNLEVTQVESGFLEIYGGTNVVYLVYESEIKVLGLKSGEIKSSLSIDKQIISLSEFSNATMLAVVFENKVQTYSTIDYEEKSQINHSSIERCFVDKGGKIGIGDINADLTIYDLNSTEQLESYSGEGGQAFALSGTALVTQQKPGMLKYRDKSSDILFRPTGTGFTDYFESLLIEPSKYLVVGRTNTGFVRVYNCDRKIMLGGLQGINDENFSASFQWSPQNNFISLIDKQKNFIFWEWNKKRQQKLVYGEKGAVLLVNNKYRVFADGNNLVKFYSEGKTYSFDQFDLHFNRPDKVLGDLYYPSEKLVTIYKKAYNKRLYRLGYKNSRVGNSFHIPELEVTNKASIEYFYDTDNVTINVKASDSKVPLKEVKVLINGVPMNADGGFKIGGNVLNYEKALTIPLAYGLNKIELKSVNTKGAESFKTQLDVFSRKKPDKVNVFVVAIGVSNYKNSNYNLDYASKDAADFIKQYEGLKGNTVNYKLLDEEANQDKVEAMFKELSTKVGVNDEFFMFFAGHGVLDENFDYHLALNTTNFLNPKEGSLSYSKLEGYLKQVKARKKLLFIDACHSGEIDKQSVQVVENTNMKQGKVKFRAGSDNTIQSTDLDNTFDLMKSTFTDLTARSGAHIISAAGGGEFAVESDEWQNGVFTYVMKKGLTDKEADLNKDGNIKLSELTKYLKTEVRTLTKGQQQPTSREVNKDQDLIIFP